MSLFPPHEQQAIRLSRDDVNEPLSCYSQHGFDLDDAHWPSVEHYYQAMKFDQGDYRERIRQADHPQGARKLGRARFKKIRKDWDAVREVVMTRAVYIKCRTHDSVADALLNTGEETIIESSSYDYYWGCGRDGRGHNNYGKVLMNVRNKLREELAGQQHN